jgi:hypothetical protein
MDRESVNRLRFDRRLDRRRGWVEESDKTAHLEALPDVSDKMTRGLDDPETAEEALDTEPGAAQPVSGFSTPESPIPGSDPFSSGGSELS